MKRRHLFSLPILTMPMIGAPASDKYEMFGVVLLQPEGVFAQRSGGVEPLVNYIKALGAAAATFAGQQVRHSPSSGFVVLAVRPNRASRIWLDLEQPLAEASASELISALTQVPPPAVTEDMVALAIKVGLWGGSPTTRATPMPAELTRPLE